MGNDMSLTTDQYIQIVSGSTAVGQVTPNFRSKRDRKAVKSLLEKIRRERQGKQENDKNSSEELDTYV
jgi:hypothetical protein